MHHTGTWRPLGGRTSGGGLVLESCAHVTNWGRDGPGKRPLRKLGWARDGELWLRLRSLISGPEATHRSRVGLCEKFGLLPRPSNGPPGGWWLSAHLSSILGQTHLTGWVGAACVAQGCTFCSLLLPAPVQLAQACATNCLGLMPVVVGEVYAVRRWCPNSGMQMQMVDGSDGRVVTMRLVYNHADRL